jgi:NAD(P)-dependent dehydrogenase (short-subunit alcohol dehydrogenase family)
MIDNYNPFSLASKTVLVTGASSGIGQETAIVCAKLGAKVVITGRNEERLSETFNALEGDGHQMIVADLNKDEDIDFLVRECPILDGMVNNAGISKSKPIQFVKRSDLEEIFATNVFGLTLLVKGMLKSKKINKNGSIVFTSSLSSRMTAAGLSVYAATKAAVCGLMRTCAIELGSKGIRSNAVLPGMVETKLIHRGTYSEEDRQSDRNNYPLGRYGKSEDIAFGIAYLLSDASKWITGTELVIDGGRSLK